MLAFASLRYFAILKHTIVVRHVREEVELREVPGSDGQPPIVQGVQERQAE